MVVILVFSEYIKDFLDYCSLDKGLSTKTRESYNNDLKVYKLYLEEKGINNVLDITTNDIENFLKYQIEHNDKNA